MKNILFVAALLPLGLSYSQRPNEAKMSTPSELQKATFGAGCFWCTEAVFLNVKGVTKVESGYSGGAVKDPSYQDVCTGQTGHAEAVRIVFDPAKISYEQLLDYFFRMHDPTTLNRQHNDMGTQYRSAIFYTSEAQKQAASRVKEQAEKSGKWKRPIVTEITKAGEFYPAEDYHQKYLINNPGGYNCHVLRD